MEEPKFKVGEEVYVIHQGETIGEAIIVDMEVLDYTSFKWPREKFSKCWCYQLDRELVSESMSAHWAREQNLRKKYKPANDNFMEWLKDQTHDLVK